MQYKDAMTTFRQQLQTAGVEITAAFIPVIRDGLLPLIQDKLVPRLQDAATWAHNMALRFMDAGEQGDLFRSRLAAVGAGVQTVGQFLYSLGQMSVGLVQVLTAPFAALGTAIGNASVGLQSWIDVYRRALQGDFSGFFEVPGADGAGRGRRHAVRH